MGLSAAICLYFGAGLGKGECFGETASSGVVVLRANLGNLPTF
jgi:hypothetical protein